MVSSLRVAHFVQCGPTTGGTVSHVALQAKHQVAMGLDVLVVAGSDGVLTESAAANGAEVIVDPCLLPGSQADSRTAGRALAEVVGAWGADLAHSHLMYAGFIGAAVTRELGIPHIYTQHMFTALDPFVRTLAQRGEVPRLIAVSEHLGLELAEFLGPDHPVHVVPNGVDRPRDTGFRLRSSDGPDVLYCGRLSPEKGADTALLTFAQLAPAHSAARLHVVGTGPDEVLLKRMTTELGLDARVEFYGSVSGALHPALDVDVALVPSRGEAASLVVMEAMASGIPVVASRVGGIPHLLDDGAAGALVPPDNPTALATEANRIITDHSLRETYVTAALARYDSLFHAKPMVEHTIDVYRAALA